MFFDRNGADQINKFLSQILIINKQPSQQTFTSFDLEQDQENVDFELFMHLPNDFRFYEMQYVKLC